MKLMAESKKQTGDHSNGSATLPRDFRYHYQNNLSTPEPNIDYQIRQPSPPKPRLKIRRRVVPNFRAPTDQFLASVAAADIPLPTIELPELLHSNRNPDERPDASTEKFQTSARALSPKTPVPTLSIDTGKIEKPDWYTIKPLEGTNLRPSSSHSDDSDISYESIDSSCRHKFVYESDGYCTSPEPDISNPYNLSSINKLKLDNEGLISDTTAFPLKAKSRNKAHHLSVWSKAQIVHLWSTYLKYLQDPTLTPLRIGKSRVPPEGVCHRVAREAKRSWKVPNGFGSHSSTTEGLFQDKNKRLDPIHKCSLSFSQWPHSSSATRSKLREICRQRTPSRLYRYQHYLQLIDVSPFPKQSPAQGSRGSEDISLDTSNIDINDIAVSLGLSTADSMNPDGPLIRLTRETPSDLHQPLLNLPVLPHSSKFQSRSQKQSHRLGSPFSRSYGPSSSRTNERTSVLNFGSLGSPLQLSQSRSLRGIQKRRVQQALDVEFSTRSIFSNSGVLDPASNNQSSYSTHIQTCGLSLGDQIFTAQGSNHIVNAMPHQLDLTVARRTNIFDSDTYDRPRLRSPFMESSVYNTFPRRLFLDHDSANDNLLHY